MTQKRRRLVHAGVLVGSIVVWVVSVLVARGRTPGPLGIMSIIPAGALVAISVALVGFAVSLRFRSDRVVQGVYVASIATMLHGLPAFLYSNLSSSWAWKHVAIVDYLDRIGTADRASTVLPAYQNWPGFFAINAWIVDASDLGSAAAYAAWAPIVFNLLYVLALMVLFKGFTTDMRLVWTAVLLFELANWVGQDYFAPQASGFAMFLMVMAILVRWYRSDGTFLSTPHPFHPDVLRITDPILVVLLLAISASHQITPIITAAAIALLVVFGGIRVRWPLILAVGFPLVWMFGPALPFTSDKLGRLLDDLGAFQKNVDGSVANVSSLSTPAQTVATISRVLTAAILGLALLGILRRTRLGERSRWIVGLAAAPTALLLLSSYGGEIVFRVFLFALPFLAFLAASLFFPAGHTGKDRSTTAALVVALPVLTGALFLAAFGGDQRGVFSDDEIAAATLSTAPDDARALVIEGSRDYPGQSVGYERFDHLTIDRLSDRALGLLTDDPDTTLARWIRESDEGAGYVVLTESQQLSVERLGTLPADLLPAVRADLSDSDLFEVVYDSTDGAAFRFVGAADA